MIAFDFYNPAALPPARTLLQVLRLGFHWRYSVVWCYGRDWVGRSEHPHRGTFDVELYGDGSGLEVSFLGRRLVCGVEAKRPAVVLSRH